MGEIGPLLANLALPSFQPSPQAPQNPLLDHSLKFFLCGHGLMAVVCAGEIQDGGGESIAPFPNWKFAP